MDEILTREISKLKELIDEDPRVLTLNIINEQLNDDLEVNMLSSKVDEASSHYNDMVKYFGENSKEAKNAQKILHEAKEKLDTNTLVVLYNRAYKSVRELYSNINNELFGEFKTHTCEKK